MTAITRQYKVLEALHLDLNAGLGSRSRGSGPESSRLGGAGSPRRARNGPIPGSRKCNHARAGFICFGLYREIEGIA